MKSMCLSGIKKLIGKENRSFGIGFLKIFLITQIEEGKWNIFLFFLPLFRIEKNKGVCKFNLLFFVWVQRLIMYLVFGWSVERKANSYVLRLANHVIYRATIVKPYNFPSALWRG